MKFNSADQLKNSRALLLQLALFLTLLSLSGVRAQQSLLPGAPELTPTPESELAGFPVLENSQNAGGAEPAVFQRTAACLPSIALLTRFNCTRSGSLPSDPSRVDEALVNACCPIVQDLINGTCVDFCVDNADTRALREWSEEICLLGREASVCPSAAAPGLASGSAAVNASLPMPAAAAGLAGPPSILPPPAAAASTTSAAGTAAPVVIPSPTSTCPTLEQVTGAMATSCAVTTVQDLYALPPATVSGCCALVSTVFSVQPSGQLCYDPCAPQLAPEPVNTLLRAWRIFCRAPAVQVCPLSLAGTSAGGAGAGSGGPG